MTLEELTELKNLAAARERHLELAERVETRSIRSTTSLFGMPMTEDLEDVIRTGMAAEYRRRAGIAEANLRELGVLFPGDTVPLPSGTAPEGEPLIQVTFRVAGVTAVKAAMSAAEVERMRAACQAADDGYRVEA